MSGAEQRFHELVAADLRAKAEVLYESSGPKSLLRTLVSDGTSAVVLFRLSNALWHLRLIPLAIIVAKINKLFNAIVIGHGCKIGPGFVVQHPAGVVINSQAMLGRDCVLQSGVAIGAVDRQSPTLGDRVWLGSGAKVVGGVKIGSDASIGANAVVVSDIDSGVTAVGVPARPLTTKPHRDTP